MKMLELKVAPNLSTYGPRDPAAVISLTLIASQVAERAPQRVVLAVDRSSSMSGRPLEDAVACARALVDALSDQDELAIVLFDRTVEVALAPTPLDESGRRRAHEVLAAASAGWGTDLCEALVLAAQLAAASAGPARAIVITDGHAYSGEIAGDAIIRRVRASATANVSVATIGLGVETDHLLLRTVALAGRGRFTYVASGTSAGEAIGSELAVIDGTAVIAARVEVLLSPAAKRVVAYDCGPMMTSPRSLAIELPPLIDGQPLELAFSLDLDERGTAPRRGPVELGLVRVSGRRATDGTPIVVEAPIRIELGPVRGALQPAVARVECRARAACLMHDVSCDQERSDAALAAWISRNLGEIVALARSVDVLDDPQLAAAVSILEAATHDLVRADPRAIERLRIASDGVARGYDAAPGATPPVDLGPYRSEGQRQAINTIITGVSRGR